MVRRGFHFFVYFVDNLEWGLFFMLKWRCKGEDNMLFLKIDDLIINALIEQERVNGERKILLDKVFLYGEEVIEDIQRKGIYCKLKYNQESFSLFEKRYHDYICPYSVDGKFGYELIDEDIAPLYRVKMDEEVLDSFTNVQVVRKCFWNFTDSFVKKRSLRDE